MQVMFVQPTWLLLQCLKAANTAQERTYPLSWVYLQPPGECKLPSHCVAVVPAHDMPLLGD